MKAMVQKYLKSSLLFLVLFLAGSAFGQIISVNIGGDGGNTKIDGDETFGVSSLNTVVGGWNNIGWDFDNLLWADGTASTVGVDVDFPNERNFFGPGYINTPLNYGAPHYTGTADDPGTALSFYNLAENFPDGYFIIVYITGFLPNEGASITNGRTTYYYRPAADNKTQLTPEGLMQATDTADPGAGNFKEAHYAVFGSKELPITADFYKVRLDCLAGGGAALCGAQIVSASEVTPPSEWAGYPYDENGWADTASWLGWINITSEPWILILSLNNYGWIPEEGVTDSGSWVYIRKP